MTESELLARAREYDVKALAEVYDQYAEPIYRYLYRLLGDATEAEDVTSEVFVRFLKTLGTRRAPRERLGGWLYRVAHNLAMDHLRRQRKRQSMPPEESVASDSEPLSVAMVARDNRMRLRSCVQRLTSEQQQVILLRFGEGLKLAEVAELMDKSLGAVKILQHRAIRRLRKLMV